MTTKVIYDRDISYTHSYERVTWPDGHIDDYSFTDVNQSDIILSDRIGGSNPGWQAKIKMHQNATTGLTAVKREFSISEGFAKRRMLLENFPIFGQTTTDEYGRYGRLICTPGSGDWGFYSAPTDFSWVYDEAYGKFYNKARQAIQKFEGGVFVGELREVIHSIRHPADAIQQYVRRYLHLINTRSRRIKKNRIRAVSNMLAGSWLEVMFSIRPLLSDLDGAIQALAGLYGREETQKVSAQADDIVLISSGTSYPAFSGAYTCLNQRITSKGSYRIYGEVWVTLPRSPCQFLASNDFGVGIDNFVPTIWELIPGSFLLDYFTNIGEIVNATSFPLAQLAWVSVTKKTDTRNETSGSYDEQRTRDLFGESMAFATVIPGTAVFSEKVVERSIFDLSSRYTPSLRFNLGQSVLHALNIVALLQMSTSTSKSLRNNLRI